MTPWRRRRTPFALCSIASGRRRDAVRSPIAMPAGAGPGGGQKFPAGAVGTGAITRRSCARRAATSTKPQSKPYLQLDRIIEAAFYTASRLFGLTFERRNDVAGLA